MVSLRYYRMMKTGIEMDTGLTGLVEKTNLDTYVNTMKIDQIIKKMAYLPLSTNYVIVLIMVIIII